jgi:acyl carrier protein
MENFNAKFNKVIIDVLAVTQEQITPDARFIEDLGADSLDVVELVMQLETEFNLSIPDAMADEVKTVGQAEALVQKFLADKPKAASYSHSGPRV